MNDVKVVNDVKVWEQKICTEGSCTSDELVVHVDNSILPVGITDISKEEISNLIYEPKEIVSVPLTQTFIQNYTEIPQVFLI